MELITSVPLMQRKAREIKRAGETIALVPTMGYFHQGHLSLFQAGRKIAGKLVVSIFVNPLQFGPAEDFKQYPRYMERDQGLTQKEGVDILFAPDVEGMYSSDFSLTINAGPLGQRLCGLCRPGHFDGVCTVVAKLFHIVLPDVAFFGAKDYQQLLIIRQMVKDLNFPVEIVALPTVRELDGLALSSRNQYLSGEERREACCLFQAIELARKLYQEGEGVAAVIEQAVTQLIQEYLKVKIDYVKVCHGQTLADVKKVEEGTLLALAAFVGKTRLIDNYLFGKEP